MGRVDKRGLCHFELGISYSTLQKFELACNHLEKCTTLYAEVRRLLFEKDAYKISLSDVQAGAYRLYTQCLLQQEKDEEALLVTERARSAALADMMVVSYGQQDPREVKRENLSGTKIREVFSRIVYYALSGKGKENVIVWSFQPNGDPKFMGEATEWKNLLGEALVEIGVNVKANVNVKAKIAPFCQGKLDVKTGMKLNISTNCKSWKTWRKNKQVATLLSVSLQQTDQVHWRNFMVYCWAAQSTIKQSKIS